MTEEGFTVKEILLKVDAKVDRLSDKLDRIDRQGSIGTREELSDHESRLRSLEKKSWALTGVSSALGVAAGVLSAVFGPHAS